MRLGGYLLCAAVWYNSQLKDSCVRCDMYALNKIIWFAINPAMVGLTILLVAMLVRRFRTTALCLGFAWFWMWSSPAFTRIVGLQLEKEYLSGGGYPSIASVPVCDAIADMGGGVGGNTNMFDHAFLNSSADRAYVSAELWKAKKAPIIVPSGTGVANADRVFMLDLGVPEEAIVVENKAMNTEQNAKLVRQILLERTNCTKNAGIPRAVDRPLKVLVVTSAWHMKRTMLMFEKYAPEIDAIPMACDFECAPVQDFSMKELIPNPEVFGRNSVYLHEWIGYWGYRFLRK